MRKLLYASGLTSALVFALAAQAAAPNFAGTWTLDKSKSQGLNPRWQNAESVTWNVTQTARYLGVPLSTLKFKIDRLEIRDIARRIKGA